MLIQKDGDAPERWFAAGFGRLVAAQEQRLCDRLAADSFGFYGVQLGMPARKLMRRSPVLRIARIGAADSGCDIAADWSALPLADDSADVVLLAHALEAAAEPRAVLREAVRVLRPEGRLVIIGFNPWSLLGFFAKPARAPWRENWLSLARVKDWLALLQITVVRGMFAVFLPPLAESKTRRRFAWLERAGRRWWPLAGGVYFMLGIKRRTKMRLITPAFRRPPQMAAGQQMRP
ncbi:MAG: class I SAM-dependent methyltransferase [Gammaproteobacteria bacterium]